MPNFEQLLRNLVCALDSDKSIIETMYHTRMARLALGFKLNANADEEEVCILLVCKYPITLPEEEGKKNATT